MGVTFIYDWDRVVLTDHAIMRGKERLGLGKKALKRMSDKAFKEGVALGDMYGSLYRYISEKLDRPYTPPISDVRLYGEYLFLYSAGKDQYFGDTFPILVTILLVPAELRRQAILQFKKSRVA